MTILFLFKKLLKRQDGGTSIEYALMAAGIALAIFTAVHFLGQNLSMQYNEISAAVASVAGEDVGSVE